MHPLNAGLNYADNIFFTCSNADNKQHINKVLQLYASNS